jgi:hypothetical protein
MVLVRIEEPDDLRDDTIGVEVTGTLLDSSGCSSHGPHSQFGTSDVGTGKLDKLGPVTELLQAETVENGRVIGTKEML